MMCYILVHKLLTLQFGHFKSSSVNQLNLHCQNRYLLDTHYKLSRHRSHVPI